MHIRLKDSEDSPLVILLFAFCQNLIEGKEIIEFMESQVCHDGHDGDNGEYTIIEDAGPLPAGLPPAEAVVDLDGSAPVEQALRLPWLNEEDQQRHAQYLHAEGYVDVASLRNAMQHEREWKQLRLPTRLKCAVERTL